MAYSTCLTTDGIQTHQAGIESDHLDNAVSDMPFGAGVQRAGQRQCGVSCIKLPMLESVERMLA